MILQFCNKIAIQLINMPQFNKYLKTILLISNQHIMSILHPTNSILLITIGE